MMFLVVVLALTRELTELVIFYSGIIQAQGSWTNAVTGGFAGLTIGASIGVLVFATIDRLSLTFQMIVQVVLLALVAAGTVVQGIQLLMQVDWVSATSPVWDTNHLLAEVSITGQMFYAVFGYEATPTLLEVVFYWVYYYDSVHRVVCTSRSQSVDSFEGTLCEPIKTLCCYCSQ